MDNLVLYNKNGERFETKIIRYITLNGKNYLIFTLSEKDEQDYVKLYASRIEETSQRNNSYNLSDSEWDELKKMFHVIVNNNRNGIQNDCDLPFIGLNSMVIMDYRPFKLRSDTCIELAANKKNEFIEKKYSESIAEKNNAASELVIEDKKALNVNSDEINYEKNYRESLQEIESLKRENSKLKKELEILKDQITKAITELSQF